MYVWNVCLQFLKTVFRQRSTLSHSAESADMTDFFDFLISPSLIPVGIDSRISWSIPVHLCGSLPSSLHVLQPRDTVTNLPH